MTVESYQAWDGKKYKWPPPEGWYIASDKKWWPEGYGPKADAAKKAAREANVSEKETVTPKKIDGEEKHEDPEVRFAESLKKYRSNHPELGQEERNNRGGGNSQGGSRVETHSEVKTAAAPNGQAEVIKNLTPVSHKHYLGKNQYLTNTAGQNQNPVVQKSNSEKLGGSYEKTTSDDTEQLSGVPESASKPMDTFQNMSGYDNGTSVAPQATISDILLPPAAEKKKKKTPKILKMLVFLLLLAALAAGGFLAYSNYFVDDSKGSFINPYERNSDPVALQEDTQASWIFQLGEPAKDVSSQVTNPKPGFVYLETPLEIWLEKGLPAEPISELGIAVLDADKNSIARASNCNSDSPLEMTASASAEAHVFGSLCWEVPSDKLDSLRMEMSVATSKGGVYRFIQD